MTYSMLYLSIIRTSTCFSLGYMPMEFRSMLSKSRA